jgi:molybdopterin-guanine dinucleotide biosynthesis protein A
MSGADFTVAILIGGDSSRMGTDKATYEIDGVPMAQRVADAATSAGAASMACYGSVKSPGFL